MEADAQELAILHQMQQQQIQQPIYQYQPQQQHIQEPIYQYQPPLIEHRPDPPSEFRSSVKAVVYAVLIFGGLILLLHMTAA